MALSNELIKQFVKMVNTRDKADSETTVYGQVVAIEEGDVFVRLDGAELTTPAATTADVKTGDRVTVSIKNHTATITGNLESPAARTHDVQAVANTVDSFEMVSTDDLFAINATIGNLQAQVGEFEEMSAVYAEIESLSAKFADLKYITTDELTAYVAQIDNLKVKVGEFTDISAENLTAINANLDTLKSKVANFSFVSADRMDTKYVNIDLANIDEAWIKRLYAESGLIQYVTSEDMTVTGHLVGVTIRGDLIEAGTLVADKLVIKGDDGLYYKLNYEAGVLEGETAVETVLKEAIYDPKTDTWKASDIEVTIVADSELEMEGQFTDDGRQLYVGTEESQGDIIYYKEQSQAAWVTENLHGSAIVAKSVTAEKISVSDLVAFGATIGGFNITMDSIFSAVKDSDGNTTRGIYMDTDGQFNFGDDINFVRYYKGEDGSYHLAISAESVQFAVNNGEYGSLADILGHVKIGTYGGEPCVEISQDGEDSKVVITNTQILFKVGESTPAYVSNKALNIEKAVVTDELRLGNKSFHDAGWVWKTRANGNIGLSWAAVATITFAISSQQSSSGVYTAVDGMTWAEWCMSPYNTAGFFINESSSVETVDQDLVGNSSGEVVHGFDLIIADHVYIGDI